MFWDQEALNAVLAGKWGALDARWNHNANARGASRPAACSVDLPLRRNVKPWDYPSADHSRRAVLPLSGPTEWTGWRPKRSLVGGLITTYQSSRLRTVLYPTEKWLIRLLRTLTRKYAA